MTKYERKVKEQELLTHMEAAIVDYHKAMAELVSDTYMEIDALYGESGGAPTFTEVQNRARKISNIYFG